MKKMKKRLALILSMTVFITSFGFFGVFAEEETTPSEPTAPAAVANLTAYSSYNGVVLRWTKDANATSYKVNGAVVTPTDLGNGMLQYATPNNLEPGVDVAFSVVASNEKGDSPAATVVKAPVRAIAYKVKIKVGGTLRSHAGPKAKYKVKRGQTIYADRYGAGGKYIFSHNGSTFYCDRLRTSKRKAIYTRDFNYTPEEAQFFVNAKGLSSRTGVLIWISTYTQHIYMFQGTKGNWTCIGDYECSTGTASTPTPTGITGQKTIYKKIRSRHGIPWWSPFSDINSIHGKKSGWKLGKPASNGCVRNYNENAKVMYKTAKKGTRVMVY